MGFLDRLFGRDNEPDRPPQQGGGQGRYAGQGAYGGYGQPQQPRQPQQLTDEQAIARYRYMLRTAPPETIEQAHAEAFAQLTPQQRQIVLQELSSQLPEHERAAYSRAQDDPNALARMATRAEMRQPGTLERTFSNVGPAGGMGGVGLGGLMAGSFLSSIAGVVIGSAIANAFFNDFGGYDQGFAEGYQAGDQNAEADASGYDAGAGDYGGDAGGDFGTDTGDFGGDFGGGDFGGDF